MTGSDGQVEVTVGLIPALWDKLHADPIGPGALTELAEAGLAELAENLGLAPGFALRLALAEGDEGAGGISVTVNGRPAPYPSGTALAAHAYVQSAARLPADDAAAVAELTALDSAELAEAVALVCQEAVGCNAGDLPPSQPADGGAAGPGGPVPVIELCLHESQLGSLLAEDPEGTALTRLRDQIAEEVGIRLPVLGLRLDHSLRTNGYAFRLAGARSLPRIGLAADQLLVVGASAETLSSYGLAATASALPSAAAAITARTQLERVEALGFTVRRPHEYLLADLSLFIRQHAAAVVTDDAAAEMLSTLGGTYPTVAQAARDHVPTAVLGTVLRDLLADQVPVCNLRRIVELCLRERSAPTPADLAAAVRAGLADTIARTASQGGQTIQTYLLDATFTAALADLGADQADGTRQRLGTALRAGVQAELDALPSSATRLPVLLTSADARRTARRLLCVRFPRLRVVSFAELPAYVTVQPLARISMPDSLAAV